ncbi:MAG TPA: GMC family oxidoreductase [Pyrinomonadaceae bacterium]|nr:GMC family oxidoreductase [Pyrinomonadaceae bacterium]
MQSQKRHFDAAVVGLGAAGSWAAKVLTENGLSVVALDAGRVLSATDLPRHITPLSKKIRPASYWTKLLFGRRKTQSRSISFHPQIEHLYVDDKENPYSTRGGDNFLWIRGRQVGGRLHTWARMALRLSDFDLKRAESDGWGIPWPIRYSDLAPYYDKVEACHGLYGSCDGIPYLPDGVVSEQGAFSEPAALFKNRIETRWPERRVIIPRILRHNIEPIHAPLMHAIQTDRLRLITEAAVARLLCNKEGNRGAAVEFIEVETGQKSTVSADLIFLCASSIESVRILLNSHCAQHPAGLGNNHDLLGRYMLDHNFVIGSGYPGDVYRKLPWTPRESTPLNLSTDLDFYIPDFTRSLQDRSFIRGFGIQGTLTPTYWAMAVFGEMLPHEDNRVTLSHRVDAFGIPAVNISIQRRSNDKKMIESQKQQLLLLAKVAGLEVKMPLPRMLSGMLWKAVGPELGVLHLGLAVHECGGARMGDTPEVSVLDHRNRVWGTENVYVTDGSCFPNTGCQNPTLTIMALTARACELALQGGG